MTGKEIAKSAGDKAAGIVGSVLGALIALPGGPIASAKGAAIGSLAADTMKDVLSRTLSNKERKRVDNAVVYIATAIQEKVAADAIVRQDDFFIGEANYTSDAEQILEGVLLKCKSQFEEKKVRLISNIFAYTAYNEGVTAATAYQILSLADTFNYYKLCVLSLYGRKDEFNKYLNQNKRFQEFDADFFKDKLRDFAQATFELYDSDLIHDSSGNSHLMRITLIPFTLELTEIGKIFFNMLSLNDVESEDITRIIRPLKLGDE